MKTLNKKHLEIINDLLFTMRSNDDLEDLIKQKDVQTDEDKTFATYLFWDTRVVSIRLYENYGISYFTEATAKRYSSEKEDKIKQKDEAYKSWKEASEKVA